MMIQKMERSAFNKEYQYNLIDVSADGVFYKCCGNCCHFGLNADDIWRWSGYRVCGLIMQSGNDLNNSVVNPRRGKCNLWQEAKE